MAKKKPVSKSGQGRVSAKIGHLVKTGEVPNTKAGRAKAAGMAYGMERAGRLGEQGGYRRVERKGRRKS